MKKYYITPVLYCVGLKFISMVCASDTVRLRRREGVTGEEADSRAFGGTLLWDDCSEYDE